MSFLFGLGKKPRASPEEWPRQARELLDKIDTISGTPKAEELSKVLVSIKGVLHGTQEYEYPAEQVHNVINNIIHEDILYTLALTLHKLSFESRKDAQAIFSAAFRYRPPGVNPKTEPVVLSWVINSRPAVLVELCNGYNHKESAIPAGTVLREVLKSDAAAAIILYDDVGENGSQYKGLSGIRPDLQQSGEGVFWKFFSWIDKGTFEVGADAFTTFRELLTKHKPIVSQYLATNFDRFFNTYNSVLLTSSSYVTKRQSIKLLGELLLDRANYSVMTLYVSLGPHLKIIMNLLRDDRKMVQYEGFHVFKVFVANPHKSIAVQKILIANRERLLRFLRDFLQERTEDEQFLDEREFLVRQIKGLPESPVEPVQKPTLMSEAEIKQKKKELDQRNASNARGLDAATAREVAAAQKVENAAPSERGSPSEKGYAPSEWNLNSTESVPGSYASADTYTNRERS